VKYEQGRKGAHTWVDYINVGMELGNSAVPSRVGRPMPSSPSSRPAATRIGLALGYMTVPREHYPPEMTEARDRVFAAAARTESHFSRHRRRSSPSSTRVCGSSLPHRKETVIIDRAYQRRAMPV
jgi:hypothetical protein